MISLSREEVKQVFKSVEKSEDVAVVYSRSVTAYFKKRLAKRCLAMAGVEKVDAWLKTRWMTIIFKNKAVILCPEKIGASNTSPDAQAIALGRELSHVKVFRSLGSGWIGDYFLKPGARGAYHEAHAEASGADVRMFLGKAQVPSSKIFDLEWSKAYLCSPAIVKEAREVFDRLTRAHKHNMLASGASGGAAVVINAIRQVRNLV